MLPGKAAGSLGLPTAQGPAPRRSLFEKAALFEEDAEEVNKYFSYSEKIALDIATSGEQFLRLNKKYNITEKEIRKNPFCICVFNKFFY